MRSNNFIGLFQCTAKSNAENSFSPPIKVLIKKEVSSHIRSWRFIILISLIVLTFGASLYVSFSGLRDTINNSQDPDSTFVYLKLLTTSDNTVPPFHVFLNFLAPLLGIALGFDAINSEQNGGTLTRLVAQPIYRDNLLLSKFFAPLIIVSVLFTSLIMLMIGAGIISTGIKIEFQEVVRIIGFIGVSIIYVAFWLSLAILLSIVFRQGATSAMTAIGIWLFFTIFFPIVINFIIRPFIPNPNYISEQEYLAWHEMILNLMRLSPSQLYTDATTSILMPSIRSLGPVSMEQMIAAIPTPLSFIDSLMIVWPQLTGITAGMMICFALSYLLFMRREIRC
ncbi:MAG: ABC transporter permease subunit [Sphingobacterium composti]|uniref:ABC transporter permease subunit n=1 Tax=Sphingobacterium composti TaxID=363260 RepID=UPI001358FFA7|nr:ABC transporter permease subunit [Sphingobacterium composti Ten et al. 2007 non Yoo et al. 2007]